MEKTQREAYRPIKKYSEGIKILLKIFEHIFSAVCLPSGHWVVTDGQGVMVVVMVRRISDTCLPPLSHIHCCDDVRMVSACSKQRGVIRAHFNYSTK